MTDTQKRLDKIATDINNYFDNDVFDEYEVNVEYELVTGGIMGSRPVIIQADFIVTVNNDTELLDISSMVRGQANDKKIKKVISDYIFQMLARYGFLPIDTNVDKPNKVLSFAVGRSGIPSEYWPTDGYLDNMINRGNDVKNQYGY